MTRPGSIKSLKSKINRSFFDPKTQRSPEEHPPGFALRVYDKKGGEKAAAPCAAYDMVMVPSPVMVNVSPFHDISPVVFTVENGPSSPP